MHVLALSIETQYEGSRLHSVHPETPESLEEIKDLMFEMREDGVLHCDQRAVLKVVKLGFEQDVRDHKTIHAVDGVSEYDTAFTIQAEIIATREHKVDDGKVSRHQSEISYGFNVGTKGFHKATRQVSKQILREYTR